MEDEKKSITKNLN